VRSAGGSGSGSGVYCDFEGKKRFPQLGVNISVLQPGESLGRYHRENAQEDFLVVSGRCVVIVEDEERELGPWDLFHSPPGTAHMIVGAGDGPSVVIAVGTRGRRPKGLVYLVSEAAAKHGVSVAKETKEPKEAYADLALVDAGVVTRKAGCPTSRRAGRASGSRHA
jgi:uncharacterized cupin superfamily protein